MIKHLIYGLLEYYLKNSNFEVDVYFSKVKYRKVACIEFHEEFNYKLFLNNVKEIIQEQDISFQDSTGIIIDLTDELLNKILSHVNLLSKNEMLKLDEV
jgi:hypothetical protein